MYILLTKINFIKDLFRKQDYTISRRRFHLKNQEIAFDFLKNE